MSKTVTFYSIKLTTDFLGQPSYLAGERTSFSSMMALVVKCCTDFATAAALVKKLKIKILMDYETDINLIQIREYSQTFYGNLYLT